MYEILAKQEMAKGTIVRFDVYTPEIAAKIQPGQFVIIRVNETGERIPLTVADVKGDSGTIVLIFQVVGKTTALMRSLNTGDFLLDVVGPLGRPAEINNFGNVIMVGGGTGVAILYHVMKALSAAGNHLTGIVGARTKELLFLEQELDMLCDKLVITTDDGSHGQKGFVTDPLQTILRQRSDVHRVYAVGPIIMMKNVCKLTKQFDVPTIVSLNPIMIDGTGMCGGCRVSIGGQTRFCCVDGPDFDGHAVDFDELQKRGSLYAEEEQESVLLSIK